jgi:hypothetical protein
MLAATHGCDGPPQIETRDTVKWNRDLSVWKWVPWRRMKQGVQYYGVCNKEDTEAPMQCWCWFANFYNVIAGWGAHKIANFWSKDSIGWGACSWKLRWPKYLAAIKIFGGRQNFDKILGCQNFVRDSMAGQNYSPPFLTGSPHIETRRPTKKFPFGDSPLPNRVCAHTGINRYTQIQLTNQALLL